MTPNLNPPPQPSPSFAASSKQNTGKVIQPLILDLKRPNPAEKVQQSPQGLAPTGWRIFKLPTFETPKSSSGVPPQESQEQQQPLAPKSFTSLGVTHPQVSYGPIRAPDTPLPPNDPRHTTPKPMPPSQISPPLAASSKQNPGAGIQPPSPPDPKLSNPAFKIQQLPQGPVFSQSTDVPDPKLSLDATSVPSQGSQAHLKVMTP